MATSASIILIYCIATLIAIVARRTGMPYTAALFVAGVALGASHVVTLPHLTKELLFAVFLPGLLFEASYHLRPNELRENAWTIGALTVPGVAAAIGLTATMLVLGSRMMQAQSEIGWQAALLFGAVIAATDPVAVTSLLRDVSAPRRLRVLLEAESLLNDGTSIVFFGLLLAYLAGAVPSVSALLVGFVRMTVGGALLGIAVGWVVSHVRRQVDDAAIEITLTTIAAYGSFVLAEELGCSGVIATVAAGVTCGHASRRHAMSATTHAVVDGYWEWMAFALNSAVFLLLGAEISPSSLVALWPVILVGVVATLGARALVVGIVALLMKRQEPLPIAWQVVLVWGGLRGALSLVLALAIPDSVADRSLVISLAAGAVVASLIGQGATMSLLLRTLKIGPGPSTEEVRLATG